jgi:cell division protein FtsB
MSIEQVKRLKELEKENTRLKRLVADLSRNAKVAAGQRCILTLVVVLKPTKS